MADAPEAFSPILLGAGLSPASYDVAQRLATVPTLTELTARLGALPRAALEAACVAEPQIYESMIDDARQTSAFLRSLCRSFDEIADRLERVGGK